MPPGTGEVRPGGLGRGQDEVCGVRVRSVWAIRDIERGSWQPSSKTPVRAGGLRGGASSRDFSPTASHAGKLVAHDTFTSEPDGSIIVTYDSTGKAPGLYHTVVTYLARGNQVIAGDFTISGPSGSSSRFFPETGFTVSGRFLTYWETNG